MNNKLKNDFQLQNILILFIFFILFTSATTDPIGNRPPISIPGVSAKSGRMTTIADCNLPKVVGVCRALIPAFYYNSAEQKCQPFGYGGCQGNANNFNTLKKCQSICEIPLRQR